MFRKGRLAVLGLSLVTSAGACTSSDSGDRGDEDEGEESGPSASKDAGDDGDGPSGAGDFGAVWRQVSADLTVIDTDDPTPKQVSVAIPSLLPFPETDREVELFEQFTSSEHITYAHVDGASEYHRIAVPALAADDDYVVQHADGVRIYTMEEGHLMSFTTLTVSTHIVQSFTRYAEYQGEFPPKSWPKKVIETSLEEAP